MEQKSKRKPGRIPTGTGPDGKPEPVSAYPRLTLIMKPSTKAKLDAAATMMRVPAWRIMDEAFSKYMEGVSPEDRKVIESFAKQIQKKTA